MTKQPKVRKPHPVLHGIGLVLSVILLVAVLVGTYVLSTMATIIDSFIGAPSGHYSDAEIADTKVKAEALAADVEAEGTVLVQNNDNTLPLAADNKKINVFGWASTAWLGGGSGSGGVSSVNTDLLAALTAYGVAYNTELTDMYKDFQDGREYTRTLSAWPEQSGRLYEPDINNQTYYTQSMLDNAKSFSDTAVVVIGRLAGESNDATKQQYKRTEKGGDIVADDTRTMLELTTEEEDLLNYVGANYAHVVVLMRTPVWRVSVSTATPTASTRQTARRTETLTHPTPLSRFPMLITPRASTSATSGTRPPTQRATGTPRATSTAPATTPLCSIPSATA